MHLLCQSGLSVMENEIPVTFQIQICFLKINLKRVFVVVFTSDTKVSSFCDTVFCRHTDDDVVHVVTSWRQNRWYNISDRIMIISIIKLQLRVVRTTWICVAQSIANIVHWSGQVAFRGIRMVYDLRTEFSTATRFGWATHPRIRSLPELAYLDLPRILLEFYTQI